MNEQTLRNKIKQAAREGATSLNLYRNQLSSLPAEIGQLANLQTLDLYNKISHMFRKSFSRGTILSRIGRDEAFDEKST